MTIRNSRTKIVATVGPASDSPEMIEKLLLNGVDVFRLNFSHGSHEVHDRTIETIHAQCGKHGLHRAILADLQGPKIRTGRTVEDRTVRLETGSHVTVSTDTVTCSDKIISTDYPDLNRKVVPGQFIMINDGAVRLKVESVASTGDLRCIVVSGGDYSSHKGVNLPDVDLGIPPLGEKDLDDLAFILERDVQYIAMSFVRTSDDLINLNRAIRERRDDIKVIAKIEKPEAARGIDNLLEECDGIMVARGDLGVEASPWEVPILQKRLVASANRAGKLVIVATQMLESMIHNPIPTRAESSDVANAVIDGTDAIMLSGETAVGSFPVQSVEMMRRIANLAEASSYTQKDTVDLSLRSGYPPFSVCEAAVWASRDMGELPICVFTLSGETAFYLSKLRSGGRIFAFTPKSQVADALSLAWGILPFVLPFEEDLPDLHAKAEALLVEKGLVALGEMIVIISGTTPIRGRTDMMRIKKVGSIE